MAGHVRAEQPVKIDGIRAQAYRRISSYLQAMVNQGHNSPVAIQAALSGRITETGRAAAQL